MRVLGGFWFSRFCAALIRSGRLVLPSCRFLELRSSAIPAFAPPALAIEKNPA